MNDDHFVFKGTNGQDIFTWYWSTPEKPVGIMQIFHGMAEHAERYADFAAYMNRLGYAVYACDERGHGRTGELNHNLCDLDKDGFNGIMQDQHLLSGKIRADHPGIPLFILAHSFGSFIAQEYIKHYGTEIDGVILSGSCRMEGPMMPVGYGIAVLSLIFGKSRPNKLADFLSFGSYNKRIKDPESKFDWTSRDREQVKKYEADKYCGFVVSSNFFYYFCKALLRLNKDIGSIPEDLPVYILSGAEDPVGKYGKGAAKLYEGYRKLGLKDLQFKLYPEYRHEILNELNHREVYQDIAAWLRKHLVLTPVPI